MKRNSLEIADAKAQLIKRNLDLLALAKQEVRELTEEEDEEFKNNEEEIQKLDEEQKELDEELEKEDEKEEKSNINISRDKRMKTNEFSIVRAIKAAYDNREQNVVLRAPDPTGMNVEAEGEDVVPVDLMSVLSPLVEDRALVAAGCKLYTTLSGDLQISIYQSGSAQWKSENAEAEDGSGSFTSITLSPKRVTCFIPISKQFLIQAIPSAEAEIRADIARMFWDKIESALFSDAEGTATVPQGLLYGLTAEEVADYGALTELEANLRENKYKNVSAIVSPRALANFKAMQINDHVMVYQGGKLDEMDTVQTSLLEPKSFLVGDFSQVVIGIWANPEIQLIEDSYYAKRGQVCLVLNAYADAKLAREDALVLGTTDIQ